MTVHASPTIVRLLLLSLLTILGLGTALPAQGAGKGVELKYLIPEKLERKTKADEAGLLQWEAFETENCATCRGNKTTVCAACDRQENHTKCLECSMKKVAPCRACGGVGQWSDPLEKALCPGCMGAGMLPCDVCGGVGNSAVQGGGDKRQDCVGCKGDGSYKCTVCNGARLVESLPALKPGGKQVASAQLAKAKKAVDDALTAIKDFDTTGKPFRKSIKEYAALLQSSAATVPVMKKVQKHFDEVQGKTIKGEVWQQHEEREANAIKRFKAVNEYYLKIQSRMLELAIARAEANEKVLAEKKGK